MVIIFLAFFRRLFTISLARTELHLLLHLTELTVHVTCIHASTNCTITLNISTLKTEALCSSETPVCTYKSVWYHNTMTTNRIYYKSYTASLIRKRKWEEVVARFRDYVCCTAQTHQSGEANFSC